MNPHDTYRNFSRSLWRTVDVAPIVPTAGVVPLVHIVTEPDDAPPRYAREIDEDGCVQFFDLNP